MLNTSIEKNIYWERQRGNNCRIHSLNAYFGESKISDSHFKTLCEEYDSLITGLESIKMDGFAECRSIISFIVDKFSNKFCQLVPINLRGVHNKNRDFWNYSRYLNFFGKEGGVNCYFEFNKDHVWFNKNIHGEWYKIDSLSGVNNINKLRKFGENGYLLVFDNKILFYEIEFLIKLISKEKNNDRFESEIAFNNLYHILKRVQFKYIENDTNYNRQVSDLKTIFKILKKYIIENRKQRLNQSMIQNLKKQLYNIVDLF